MDDKQNRTNTEDAGADPSWGETLDYCKILGERRSQNQLKQDHIIAYVSMAGAGFCAAGAKTTAMLEFAFLYIIVGLFFALALLSVVSSFRKGEKDMTQTRARITKHLREKGLTGLRLQGETKNPFNDWAYWLFNVAFIALIIVFLCDVGIIATEEINAKEK